jgi:glucose-6-phosphate 1-dehydrogenase
MSQITPSLDPAVIVIFGASGDLTRRKLIPALHSLGCEGMLPRDVQVVGVARSPYTDQAFRDSVFRGVSDYARCGPALPSGSPTSAAAMTTRRPIEDWASD